MTSVSQVLVFLFAILLHCILKDKAASCFSTSFVFIMSPVVSELTFHAVCLCFRFRHLTKQIPTLHILIWSMYYPLVILYIFFYSCFNMVIQKITLNQKTSKLIACLVVTGMSIVYWLKIYQRFLKLKHTTHSILMISSAYQKQFQKFSPK